MMTLRHLVLSVLPVLLLASGCNRHEVIPERMESQVDRDLRYVDVKENPEQYRGKMMLAGGKVLSATRTEEGTRIEVLQYPLSSDLVPEEQRMQSKGRFVAVDMEGNHVIDPAVLEDNEFVTLVGEVAGTTTIKIDQVEEQVPKLKIKHVTVWDKDRLRPYSGYHAPHTYGYGPYYGRSRYW
jgi:outer membrane lipoprotein